MSTYKPSPDLLAHEQLLRAAPKLLAAAKDASAALHELHPREFHMQVGRGICTWGPCKELFDAITAADTSFHV